MSKSFKKISRSLLILVNFITVLILGLIDYITGIEFSFSIFYFLPITIIAWYIGIRTGIFFSFICAAIWFLADLIGGNIYSSNYIFGWNVLMRLSIFLTITIIIYNLRKNSEMVMKNKLIAQKSYNIINTSQRIIGIIAENITKHNSELIFWITKQKANGKIVSKIIESTSQNIASNLRALTEICFSYQSSEKDLDLESFINSLQIKITEVNKKISDESNEKNNKK